MIPLLFASDATSFTGNGLGKLADAVSCKVVEERNGTFDLTMVYPVGGVHYEDIYDQSIIVAIPSPYRSAQPFRIYYIEQPINGLVTIKAHHLSYDLCGIPVEMFSTSTNVSAALSGLVSNSAVSNPFSVYTDKTTSGSFTLGKPMSFRAALGGTEGSILDVFGGGEYLWDSYNVNLLSARGSLKNYKVAYAKNIVNFKRTNNSDGFVTGVYPFWQKDGQTVVLNQKIVYVYSGNDDKIITVDLTDHFESKPTKAQLLAEAQKYITENNLGYPTESLEVSFVDLAQFPEYAVRADNLQIDLCDSVTVVFPMYGIETTEKIVKIETNVLLDRYETITIGHTQTTTADTIAKLETSSSTGGGGVGWNYPIGSVLMTNTNDDPSSYLSGTWSLIDKQFESRTRSASVSRNTTNFSALSVTAIYEGHNITFVGSMTSSVSIGETNLEVLTQTLSDNGASALPEQIPFSGYSDGANAIVLMDIDTAGRVRTLDVVVRGTGTSIASGSVVTWSVTCPCVYTAMQDSFCDKFYWERTS